MQYHLTFLREEHVPSVAALEKISFSDPWSEAAFRYELLNPGGRFVVAESDTGLLLGYLGLHVVLDEGHIANIAVDPLFRRQGVGAALLSDVQTFARKNKLSFLTLEVRENNLAAQNLYRKFGFLEVGRRKDYYNNPKEDALLMTWTPEKEENT